MISTFKDGTQKSSLFGVGKLTLDYILQYATATPISKNYMKCSLKAYDHAWMDKYTSDKEIKCRSKLDKRLALYSRWPDNDI